MPAGLALTTLACAPALREPPELVALTGAPVDEDEARELNAAAAEAFDARTVDAVYDAARRWSRAAGAEAVRTEALVGAVRARVWLADRVAGADERKRLAREAVEAGQWCERTDPSDPRCAYWLAVALGVQARERRSTALDALDRIVERLRQVIEADPTLDRGGPHRVLALVYLRAPGWPSGPGDPDLGLEEAEAAVDIDPDYPPNQLALGEALAATESPTASREAYRRAEASARILREKGEPEADRWLAEAAAALRGP